MAKKKRDKQIDEAIIKIGTSTPVIALGAVGVGIYLLPRAASYLTAHIEEGTAYLLGGLWKAITGAPKQAKELIEDSGEYYRKLYEEYKRKKDAEKWTETNPDFTTTEIIDTASIEEWRSENQIPPTADFILKPQDAAGLRLFGLARASENAPWSWDYYGVKIINKQAYWMLLPSDVKMIYKDEIYLPGATVPVKREFVIPPLPWPAEAGALTREAQRYGGI